MYSTYNILTSCIYGPTFTLQLSIQYKRSSFPIHLSFLAILLYQLYIEHMMLSSPFVLSTDKRQNRSFIQGVTPFLNNLIFQYTNPLPFETEPHTIHTIPLAREHCYSDLYYIRYKTLEITPSQTPFQVIFNPVRGINTGTYYRTFHPQNITLSIQDVFITYMQRSIEFNGNQDPPIYLPPQLQDLKHKSEYFEVPDVETKIQTNDNPHYWLQQDILQVKKTPNTDSLTILLSPMTLFHKSKSLLTSH